MNPYVDNRADVGESDDEDVSVNGNRRDVGENGKAAKRKSNGDTLPDGNRSDSSEDEDDDDEEAEREVREGFIVDEDEDSDGRKHRKLKRKRKHREAEEEFLDEEDLDLIAQTQGGAEGTAASQSKFKRIRRGHEQPEALNTTRGLGDIFNDDLDTPREEHGLLAGLPLRGEEDEFADFISDDDVSEGEKIRRQEEDEIQAPKQRRKRGINNHILDQLGEEVADMMKQAFETNEYEWALDLEEQMEEKKKEDQKLALGDVFDPSTLEANLMQIEDNIIRTTDLPERFQLAWAPYKHLTLDDEDIIEEAEWMMKQMLAKRPNMKQSLLDPFRRSIEQVLDFIIRKNFEVPFIFQHRKDYLIHAEKIPKPTGPDNPDGTAYLVKAEKLLNQNDLWEISSLDLKWRAFLHKRRQIRYLYNSIRDQLTEPQEVDVEEMCRSALSIEELQDLHEYVNFKFASLLADHVAITGDVAARKYLRPGQAKATYDGVIASPLYGLVKEFGLTADQLGRSALREGRRQFINDPAEPPLELAEKRYTSPAFSTGALALKLAKLTLGEEMFKSPRIRKYIRKAIYQKGRIDSIRTEKGKHRIDAEHPFFEIKYLRRQTFQDIAARPILFLKMLKAEKEGLINIKIYVDRQEEFDRELFEDHFKSDSYNDLAEAWNDVRREVLDGALKRIYKAVTDAAKENMKEICETVVATECRAEYIRKLDQAPWKPESMPPGTQPAVLVLSLGNGNPPHQPVCWANLREDGSVRATGVFGDLGRDVDAQAEFVNMFQKLRNRYDGQKDAPVGNGIDVIGVAGWGASNRKLLDDVEALIKTEGLQCSDFPDPSADKDTSNLVQAYMINDETARIYQNSHRATSHHPGISKLHRYCIGVGKYMQDPLLEYVALEDAITMLTFHPAQKYTTESRISAALETAMVDMVNLVGLDIEEVIHNPLRQKCLKYICGLGPRKATSFLKAVEQNGNEVRTRDELVGDADRGKVQVVGQKVFMNCAAFLYIKYNTVEAENDSEYLDNTRVHPEDYELGRKMAADALDLDELDIREEQQKGGLGAVVRRLVDNGEEDKVNDLILEEYAEQLEKKYSQKKRATLETIRAELQAPFEELRPAFQLPTSDEIFTMLTEETIETLDDGDIVPVRIRVAKDNVVIGMLDCGVEGAARPPYITQNPDIRPAALFSIGSTRQAKIIELNRRDLKAELSFLESDMRSARSKQFDPHPDEWDFGQQRQDEEVSKQESGKNNRSNRIINHPMFRAFNKTQAEEYLGAQNRGDYVIRPSSKGMDHLVITWKVADNVFDHIDVQELEKDNDFSLGKKLRAGGAQYSDLDELIVEHVWGMVRQVTLMTNNDRYQQTSRSAVGKFEKQWIYMRIMWSRSDC